VVVRQVVVLELEVGQQLVVLELEVVPRPVVVLELEVVPRPVVVLELEVVPRLLVVLELEVPRLAVVPQQLVVAVAFPRLRQVVVVARPVEVLASFSSFVRGLATPRSLMEVCVCAEARELLQVWAQVGKAKARRQPPREASP